MRVYKLTRSNRKTVALYIKDGSVEVRAPLHVPKSEIDRFVLAKEGWIAEHLEKRNALAAQRESFDLQYGDCVLYRGVEYPIVARSGIHAGFDVSEGCFYLPPSLASEQVKANLILLYRLLAKQYLSGRVLYFQDLMKVQVTNLKINSAKKRWGSMSGKQSVNFSWRVMMAADDVIDLVVVHELAHIKQMNHSPKFYAEVERILPDWREREARLKALSLRLQAQDWEV